MSDLFDDGSDAYEAEKAAKNKRIKEGAMDSLDALGGDLDYLTSDDNMFTDRMDTSTDKHKFSNEESTVNKDAKITTNKVKSTADFDKITNVENIAGFETGGVGEQNRVALADTLSNQGKIADDKMLKEFDASHLKWEGDMKNIKGDWYKALRMLQNEMLSIKGTAEGSTGVDISWEEPDWDAIFDEG